MGFPILPWAATQNAAAACLTTHSDGNLATPCICVQQKIPFSRSFRRGEDLENGTVIDFEHHFPTLQNQKGTDRPNHNHDSGIIRLQWLRRIFGLQQSGTVVTLKTLLDQFKVYMIMCNMKVADIEMMMNQLEISTTTQGFLEADADASVVF